MEAKTLKATLKETKQHTCGVEPQGLPNLIKKKNDKKPERQLKQAQWYGYHLQQKETNKMGKRSLNYKMCINEFEQKKDHPLMNTNERLNNK